MLLLSYTCPYQKQHSFYWFALGFLLMDWEDQRTSAWALKMPRCKQRVQRALTLVLWHRVLSSAALGKDYFIALAR